MDSEVRMKMDSEVRMKSFKPINKIQLRLDDEGELDFKETDEEEEGMFLIEK